MLNSKVLKIALCALLIMFVFTVVFGFKYKSDKDAKRFYLQGMSFYNKGNYSDAYYNFKQISHISELYTVSLLKQYICAMKLEDKKTAHNKLLELIRFTKDENIRPYA